MAQVRSAGSRYASNPIALASFMAGLQLQPNLLLDEQLNRSVGASGRNFFFSYVMHHVLPRVFSPSHLVGLGGRFALGIEGVGAYTVTILNRRVVTLAGFPLDMDGRTVTDTIVRADAFLALFNHALSDLAEQTLLRNAPAPTAS